MIALLLNGSPSPKLHRVEAPNPAEARRAWADPSTGPVPHAALGNAADMGDIPGGENGVLRVTVESYRSYRQRLIEAAERRLAKTAVETPPAPGRPRRIRSGVNHAELRAAKERMRARGLIR